MSQKQIAPFFIMIAAALWAIDGIFRTHLTYNIPTVSIIFFEHLLGFTILLPVFIRNFRWIRVMKWGQWKDFLLLTLVSSVLGTVLFTEALARSFVSYDFITPILIQKLQPIFVVIMSALFLKEKITFKFLFLAVMALVGSYLISFGTDPIALTLKGKTLVYLLALGAALAWGTGTILSKKVLRQLDFPAATSLRFLLAIPISFLLALMMHQVYDFTKIAPPDLWRFLAIAGITGGAVAVFIYYWGLQHTEAKIATFAELSYPIVSILIAITPLNPYGTPQQIGIAKIVGIVILLIAMILISRLNSKKENNINHNS